MAKRKPTIHDHRYRCLVQLLIKLRKDAALSQSELAIVLGLSQSDISKIESFERRLDALELFELLEVFASRLKLPMDVLLKDAYESISQSRSGLSNNYKCD
ncbi:MULTISPECIES: helix-turn-helix domain-containing protein [Citrobacter freundii complex]|jgi:transcriptional regulator with XRE-family HTH domain|uniref:helix-turn-helix domain-containing protein n=1 Tax=Citrobacter freundii complex TaxID=1344959 RepID=UPI001299B49D|nr:helix-turn-helix domain-containing protein [Citrobacter braakii]